RIARLVGPQGSVLGLDLSEDMLRGARESAALKGLKNIEFRAVASETDLGVPAGTFDAASCRMGLMFMPDPAAALRQLCRALAPGGIMAAATWGPVERCPFFGVPLSVVRRHLDVPRPQPGTPGPFALSDPEALQAMARASGFTDVRCRAFETLVNESASAE